MKSHALHVRYVAWNRGRPMYRAAAVDWDGKRFSPRHLRFACPLLALAAVCRDLRYRAVYGADSQRSWTLMDEDGTVQATVPPRLMPEDVPEDWDAGRHWTVRAWHGRGKLEGEGWGHCPWRAAADAVRQLLDVMGARAETAEAKRADDAAGLLWSQA